MTMLPMETERGNPGTCVPIIYGCTDETAINFYLAANTDNGTCIYAPPGVCLTLPESTSIYATPRTTSAVLEWNVPTTGFGTPTSYEVRVDGILYSGGTITATAGVMSHTLTGLTSGTTYEVTLQATCTILGSSNTGALDSITVTTLES